MNTTIPAVVFVFITAAVIFTSLAANPAHMGESKGKLSPDGPPEGAEMPMPKKFGNSPLNMKKAAEAARDSAIQFMNDKTSALLDVDDVSTLQRATEIGTTDTLKVEGKGTSDHEVQSNSELKESNATSQVSESSSPFCQFYTEVSKVFQSTCPKICIRESELRHEVKATWEDKHDCADGGGYISDVGLEFALVAFRLENMQPMANSNKMEGYSAAFSHIADGNESTRVMGPLMSGKSPSGVASELMQMYIGTPTSYAKFDHDFPQSRFAPPTDDSLMLNIRCSSECV